MFRSLTTPARAAGLSGLIDQRDPRVSRSVAVALILGTYAAAFLASIQAGIAAVGHVAKTRELNYATAAGLHDMLNDIAAICGALVAFFLIRRWLQISPELAGVAIRRRGRILPTQLTLAVVIGGQLVAAYVLSLLTTGATNQPVAANGMLIVGGTVSAVAAGIVEEIVVVAIPVLLGRRAGLHPGVIITGSIVLRYAYHVYHGPVATIPWIIIWAGANCVAYLAWRRLWPIVAVHAVFDIVVGVGLPFSEDWKMVVTFAALLAGACYMFIGTALDLRRSHRSLLDLRDDARRMLAPHRRAEQVTLIAVSTVAAVGSIFTFAAVGWIAGVIVTAVAASAAAMFVAQYLHAADTEATRSADGVLTGLTRYSKRPNGDVTLATPIGDVHLTDTLTSIAQAAAATSPSGNVVYGTTKQNNVLADLADLSGNSPVRRRLDRQWTIKVSYRDLADA